MVVIRVILALALALTGIITVIPEQVHAENVLLSFSGTSDVTGQGIDSVTFRGLVFTFTEGVILTKLIANMKDYGTGNAILNVYATDANHAPTGDTLGTTTKTVDSLGDYGTFSNITTWDTWDITSIELTANTEYCIVLSGSTTNADYLWRLGGGLKSEFAGEVYSANSGSTWSNTDTDADYQFQLQGTYVASTTPAVVTMDAIGTYPNSVKLPAIVTYMGEETSVIPRIEWGYNESLGSFLSVNPSVITRAGLYGYFSATITNPIPDKVYYYQASILAGDIAYIGEVKSFTYDSNVSESLVVTLDARNIKYTSAMVGVLLASMGTEASIDLYIDISEDGALDTPISVGTFTEPTEYEVTATSLTEGTTYNYRARAVGASTTYYGEIKQFTTPSSKKSTMVNKADDWLNKMGLGLGFWWVIILILMVAMWIPVLVGRMPNWVAIVLDVMVLGSAVALGLVNIFLVIVLAVIASVAIGAVVVKKVSAGG